MTPHNITSTPTTTHREGMSSGAPMEFDEHKVETHARETDLSVLYTIDPVMVDDYINTVSSCLLETSTRWSTLTSNTPPVIPT